MVYRTSIVLGAMALMSLASSAAMAKDAAPTSAPPTYEADPSVYKVIFENKYFRVIDGLRKKGQRDKWHSHPVPSVIYFITDCDDRIYTPDGKTRESKHNAGAAIAGQIVKSHSTENIGDADCHQIFVERK